MSKIDKGSLLLTTAIVLGGFVWALVEMKSQADFWHANYQFHKDKYDYYFDGANKRGLLDICDNGDGNVTVLFKEDCKR